MEENSTALVEDDKAPSEQDTINFDSDTATTTENVEEAINLDVENTFEKEEAAPPEEMKPLASSSLKEVTQPAETTFDKEVELPSEEMKPLASSSEHEIPGETTSEKEVEIPSEEIQPLASSSQHEIPAETTSDEEIEATSDEDMKPLALSSMEDLPTVSLAGEGGEEDASEQPSFEETAEQPSFEETVDGEQPTYEDAEPFSSSVTKEVEKNPFEGEGDELPPTEEEFKPLASSSLKDVKEGEIKRASIDVMNDIEMIQYSSPELPLEAIKKSLNVDHRRHTNVFGPAPYDDTLPTLYDSSSISLESSSIEDEEEEEEESETVSIFAELGLGMKEKVLINRKELEEEFQQQRVIAKLLKRRNGLLHKRIKQYYERRKITTVFDYEESEELNEKYESKLDDLFELRKKTQREKEAVDNELKDMTLLRDEQLEELNMNLELMQDREFEIGHGLIDLRTGKVILDKTIEKLLKRQKLKCEEIAKIRLAYIKKRDIVKGMEQELKELETIGGSLNLMDVEQLRMENQTCLEKIEEREEEVMRLRERYSRDIIQVGHIREKLNIIEVEIDDIGLERQSEILRISDTRKELNGYKVQRDKNRSNLEALKQSSGLLNYPKMLRDMDTALKEVEALKNTLVKLKDVHEINRIKLDNIRANMQSTVQRQSIRIVQPKFQKRISVVKKCKRRQTRPTLTYDMTARVLYFNKNMNKTKNSASTLE